LPDEILDHLDQFSNEEKWNKFVEVLESGFTLHANLTKADDADPNDIRASSKMVYPVSMKIEAIEIPSAADF